jgi:hypothetical protein
LILALLLVLDRWVVTDGGHQLGNRGAEPGFDVRVLGARFSSTSWRTAAAITWSG